jgi:subtilisin family serine protease
MTNKLDPDLRRRLRSRAPEIQPSAAAPRSAEPSPYVNVIVNFTGSLEHLIRVGFEKYSLNEHAIKHYKIATGRIPMDRLEELASIDHVAEVEGPRRFHPMLNYSVPEIHGDAVHNGHPAFTGKGVAIGVIDSGIDWRHGAFQNADGSSRILAIWHQSLPPGPGDTQGPFGGVVFTNFQNPDRLPSLDRDTKDGHGTHVAGIAAGNGRPASCCAGSGTYVGVAPEASLVVVRHTVEEDLGENLNIVHAMDFIFHGPALGKPTVINISLGTNHGAHDGTSQVEQAIDIFIAGQTGRAIVVSAGNHADEQHHVQGTVPGNNHVEIEFDVGEGQAGDAFLEIWYDRAGTLNLALTASDGTSTGIVAHGTHWPPAGHPGANQLSTVVIDGTINGSFERNNHFLITFGKPASGNFPSGKGWTLQLTNPNAGAVSFHGWIERDNKVVFLKAVDPPDEKIRSSSDSTIAIPATAVEAIAVANHDNKTNCCDCWPSEDINVTSGRGPVARATAAEPNNKPDIAAPGLLITAPKADACNLKGNCCSCVPNGCCCLYRSLDGTSMSAPHVTGTIALMLEKNPTLDKAAILKHLQATARPAPPGGTKETWGAGKLDAKAAVDAVPVPAGGGGGGPTIRNASAVEEDRVSPDANQRHRSLPPALRIARARLQAVPNGPLIAYVISCNFSEVRRLINSNRRIATLWHRSEGPAMLRRLINGAIDEGAPAAILSGEQLTCLDRWLEILHKYGSRRLQDSIHRYRSAITTLLMSPLAAQALHQVEQPA